MSLVSLMLALYCCWYSFRGRF